MFTQVILSIALILVGLLAVYILHKRSENEPPDLLIRGAVSIALLVFLFADGLISGETSRFYFLSILACFVFSTFFLKKRPVS